MLFGYDTGINAGVQVSEGFIHTFCLPTEGTADQVSGCSAMSVRSRGFETLLCRRRVLGTTSLRRISVFETAHWIRTFCIQNVQNIAGANPARRSGRTKMPVSYSYACVRSQVSAMPTSSALTPGRPRWRNSPGCCWSVEQFGRLVVTLMRIDTLGVIDVIGQC